MSLPTAVHFGAGSVGRGFLGQLLAESGYEVVFIDIQTELIEALNSRRSYPLRLVSPEGERRIDVSPVRAVNGRDADSVAEEVANAAILSTAVGGGAFPHIAGPLAKGLLGREEPVDLLICENLPDPAGFARRLLVERGGEPMERAIGSRIGLAPCIISRMVPVPDPNALADSLEVVAEPYARLPADASGFVGAPPPLKGLEPVSNFSAYVRLKLYVHNAGHAAVAYHGYPKGCVYVHEAMEDPEVAAEAEGVMREGGAALHRAEGLPEGSLSEYIEDLLRRFRNPYLGDTLARVGRDPWRKLSSGDRLVGSAQLSFEQGLTPVHTARAIAAALRFDPPGDPSAGRIQALLAISGPAGVLREASGMSGDDPLVRLVLESASPSFP
jgi:mannitol-1-phosphate 5-dehydrogenase